MIVLLHPIPEKYLDRLNEPDKSRLETALAGLEKEPPKGNIRPVSGQPGIFRARIGDFRILFRVTNNTIYITHIDPRGQVYNKKNKGNKR
jgi:mRNA-degrading endonuclease RelE of RelBE toxin-antitoxin system